MTLDPTTLAAVRERIEALRIVGDIAKRGLSWIDARNSTVDEAIGRINVMIDSPDAEPPLTAAEVRRIVDERVANVLKLVDNPDAIRKLVDDALGKPPAPPPPPKRVEAWALYGARGVLADMGVDVPPPAGAVYLTTFPGVTDAASAEAFERAVRGLFDAAGRQTYNAYPETHKAWLALAPFLPKEPQR